MPRKVELFAENPILQAGDYAEKKMDDAFKVQDAANKLLAGSIVLNTLGELNKPVDWAKRTERLKKEQELWSTLPNSTDPNQLAAQVYARQMQVAAIEQQNAMEEQMRQELKERYINQNLNVVAGMTDGQKASLAYAFPKIAGSLAAFGGGSAPHFGASGKKYELKKETVGGKDVLMSFDDTTGFYNTLMERDNPIVNSAAAHNYANVGLTNAQTQKALVEAEGFKNQMNANVAVGQNIVVGTNVQHSIAVDPGQDPRELLTKIIASTPNIDVKNTTIIPGSQGRSIIRVVYKDPSLVKKTGGSGGGGGAGSMFTPEQSIAIKRDARAVGLGIGAADQILRDLDRSGKSVFDNPSLKYAEQKDGRIVGYSRHLPSGTGTAQTKVEGATIEDFRAAVQNYRDTLVGSAGGRTTKDDEKDSAAAKKVMDEKKMAESQRIAKALSKAGYGNGTW